MTLPPWTILMGLCDLMCGHTSVEDERNKHSRCCVMRMRISRDIKCTICHKRTVGEPEFIAIQVKISFKVN